MQSGHKGGDQGNHQRADLEVDVFQCEHVKDGQEDGQNAVRYLEPGRPVDRGLPGRDIWRGNAGDGMDFHFELCLRDCA